MLPCRCTGAGPFRLLSEPPALPFHEQIPAPGSSGTQPIADPSSANNCHISALPPHTRTSAARIGERRRLTSGPRTQEGCQQGESK